MNNNMNEQNNQGVNNTFLNNGVGTFVNDENQQYPNKLENIQTINNCLNNNGKKSNKKVITIVTVVFGAVLLVVLLIILLLKSTNKDANTDNSKNPTNNKIEGTIEKEEQLIDGDVIEKEEEIIIGDNLEESVGQKDQLSHDDTYLPNTDILKKSLGQTSKFDNGISITVTNSIKYVDDDAPFLNPRLIKVELSNGSNKNFYQGSLGYPAYSTYTKNPIEFIQEDYNYTNFQMVPMYLVDNELKTEGSSCVLRKKETTEAAKIDESGFLYDINYFVLKPGEQTTAYLLCYFREKIEGAEIKTIFLFNDTNKFMYFME